MMPFYLSCLTCLDQVGIQLCIVYILINEYSSMNFCMINDEIAQSNGMYIGEENCNNY